MARLSISFISPGTVKRDLQGTVAAVCHDAGGANQIISWLRAHCDGTSVRAVMKGPAERLWQRAFPTCSPQEDIGSAIEGADVVLTGTSWGSDLEHEARGMARNVGVRSVTALDHWVNYPSRFQRGDTVIWPDEFWVVDHYARRLAEECFPGAIIRQQPNEYLAEQLRDVRPPEGSRPVLLYVLEPIRTDWGRGVPGEFQALDYFFSRVECAGLPADIPVLLRPHPSETPDKYQEWIAQHPERSIQLDTSPSIAEAISRAQYVAGCESLALTVALAAGRRVFCSLPPWAPSCRLPHEGLVHVKGIRCSVDA